MLEIEPSSEEIELDDAATSEDAATNDVLPELYTILSYGADFDVRGIVERLRNSDIEIPGFQRGFIWQRRQCARFIESLLLGLPVPGIFLWRDPRTEKFQVIDGGQRLRTLDAFYRELLFDRKFSLPERTSPYQTVHPDFQGRTYTSLEAEHRRRLDNSIIHATIISQENPPSSDTSVYYIFERLNTEGTPLQPQEIRAAIFRGPLVDLLTELNSHAAWRSIYGKVSPRLKDIELILRFIALYYANLDVPASRVNELNEGEFTYARPMKEFLNRYCQRNSRLDYESSEELSALFRSTVDVVGAAMGSRAFRRGNALNVAIFDAVMVGLARRLSFGPITVREKLVEVYDQLLNASEFIDSSSRATADEENVKKRIGLATEAFLAVP